MYQSRELHKGHKTAEECVSVAVGDNQEEYGGVQP